MTRYAGSVSSRLPFNMGKPLPAAATVMVMLTASSADLVPVFSFGENDVRLWTLNSIRIY